MYLSQLILNPRSRQVRSELARPYELHRSILSAFAGQFENERVLYRLDVSSQDGIPRLLVQSRFQPDWSKLQAKEDYFLALPGGNPQVRIYDPQVMLGQRLAFRLLANPTRSIKKDEDEPGGRGKRITIGKENDQAAWLDRKGEFGGFRVCSLRIQNLGEQRLAVPGVGRTLNPARHWAVRFDGELEVTDAVAFRQTLEKGIGSAKGFGYGLLSIARI